MGLSPRCRAERSWPPAQPPNSPSGTRCHRAAFHGEDRGCRTEQAGCHSCAGVAGALAPRRTGGAGGLKALALRPRAQRLRPSPAPHSHPAPSCLKEEAPAAPPGRRKREGASTRPRLPGGRGRVRLGLLDVLVKAMGLPVRRWEQGFAPGASKLEGLDRRGPSAGMMRVSQALRPPGTPESQTEEALVPATEHAACALWPMRTRHSVLVKGLGLTQGLECSSGQFQGSTAAPALCAPIASPSLVLGFLGWVGGQEQAGVSLRFKHRHGTLGTCWLVSFREGPVPAVPFSADAAHSMDAQDPLMESATSATWGLLAQSRPAPRAGTGSPAPRAGTGSPRMARTHQKLTSQATVVKTQGSALQAVLGGSVVSVNRCHKETRYKCGTGFEECLAVD
uniref:Uncharacterized protein n=1 Tax=Rangifer tarandus platyrhynchus TaxID=3082113 RepID=A0ACB0E5M4_RANTA|nr:unnamed protein product [Rangifer tarandus platyrhynchus]